MLQSDHIDIQVRNPLYAAAYVKVVFTWIAGNTHESKEEEMYDILGEKEVV